MSASRSPDNSLHTYHPGEEERLLERLIFQHRPLLLIIFALATCFFAFQLSKLRPDASFEKMIPMKHPFIQSFWKHAGDLGAAGTTSVAMVSTVRRRIIAPPPGSAGGAAIAMAFILKPIQMTRSSPASNRMSCSMAGKVAT